MSKDEILASNTWRKAISGTPYGVKHPVNLVVRAELTKLSGNNSPYFSITCDVLDPDKRLRDSFIAGGADHDLILKHFPQLAPLVRVHLSDPDGHPTHEEANARYWAGLSTFSDGRAMSPRDSYGRISVEIDNAGREWSPKTLASHLQISEEQAREVKTHLDIATPWDQIVSIFHLDSQWRDQAEQARRLLTTTAHEITEVSN